MRRAAAEALLRVWAEEGEDEERAAAIIPCRRALARAYFRRSLGAILVSGVV